MIASLFPIITYLISFQVFTSILNGNIINAFLQKATCSLYFRWNEDIHSTYVLPYGNFVIKLVNKMRLFSTYFQNWK